MTRFTRMPPKRLYKYYSREKAGAFLDGFGPDYELMALTNGQFSLADLVEELLDRIGVCDVDLSTWTASGYDASRMIDVIQAGGIRKMRWVVDGIFATRQPKLVHEILLHGGAMRITKSHAKFVVFRGEPVSCVLRCSMNLNANPRLEYFEITSCPEVVAFFTRLVDEIYSNKGNTDMGEVGRVTRGDIAGFDDDSAAHNDPLALL